MQHHDLAGHPLCGECTEPVLPGELYVVAHRRSPNDADASVMVHLQHFAFRPMQPPPVAVD